MVQFLQKFSWTKVGDTVIGRIIAGGETTTGLTISTLSDTTSGALNNGGVIYYVKSVTRDWRFKLTPVQQTVLM